MAETSKKRRVSYYDDLIPVDVTYHILSLLPIEDIVRCRSVCKAWNRLTKDPLFIDLQRSRALNQQQRFIVTPKNPMDRSFYLLKREGENVRKIHLSSLIQGWPLPMFGIFAASNNDPICVMGSCHGFLCIGSFIYPEPVIVCNPITRKNLVLPKSSPCGGLPFLHAALGYDPSSANYKVVKVFKGEQSSIGQIFTFGETSWRPLEFGCNVVSHTNPIYCGDGALCWIIDELIHRQDSTYCLILVLNLNTEKFHRVEFAYPRRLPGTYSNWNPQYFKLYLGSIGNKLILNMSQGAVTRVWSMSITRDGDEFCGEWHFDYCLDSKVFKQKFVIGSMDGFLLLDVAYKCGRIKNDLVLFSSTTNEYVTTKSKGLPPCFTTQPLYPNLLSPHDALRAGSKRLNSSHVKSSKTF